MVCSIEKRKSHSKRALSRTKTDIRIQDICIEWTTWSSRILWHLPERLTIGGSIVEPIHMTFLSGVSHYPMLYRKTLLETEYVVLSVDDHWCREKIIFFFFLHHFYEYSKYFQKFIFNVSYFSFFFFFANSLMHYSLFFMNDKMATFFQQFFLITLITDR